MSDGKNGFEIDQAGKADGDDSLDGEAGNGLLKGGEGLDTYAFTGSYVQAGTDGLSATDSQNRGAFLLGGSGSDTLTGGSKADLLLGNAGNDRLRGGQGSDLLLGGTGNDSYVYSSGDGLDTVLDADGSGSIVIDGDTLSGGAQYGDYRVHRSADGQHLYAQVDEKTLVIDGNIIVNAYNPGDLCLSLSGAVADPASPQTSTDLNGDREASDFDPATPGIQSHLDDWGNVIVGDTAEPDRVDHLHLHQGNNHVMSGGGNEGAAANDASYGNQLEKRAA